MTATHTRMNQLRPVQFSRLPKRGVLLGLSLAQLVTLAIGLIAFTTAVYMGGGILFGLTSPIWATSLVLSFIPAGGRKIIEWVPITLRWVWRSFGGQLRFRRPLGRQRSIDRGPTDTELPRDLPTRNPVRDKPPDQRPIFHRDHPPNLLWVASFSPAVYASDWSVADIWARRPHEGLGLMGALAGA